MRQFGIQYKGLNGSSLLAMAGAVALVLGTAACGGGGGGSDSTSTGTESGTAYAGGTLVGAEVCVDANNDLSCDSTDSSKKTTTGVDGSFTLKDKGNMLVTGGYDMDSLKEGKTLADWTALGTAGQTVANAPTYFNPYIGALQAPTGSSAVTPVTTMVTQLVASGVSQSTAETNIKNVLGITSASTKLTDLTSLTDQTAMAGIQAMGRMFRQATTAIAGAAGIDTSTTNLTTDSTTSARKDMRYLFKEVAKNAATTLNTDSGTAAKYDFSDSSKTTNLTSLVTGVIKNATTSASTATTFNNAANLLKINPDGIAALAEDSIVSAAQNVATAVKNVNWTAVPGGSLGFTNAVSALQNAGLVNLITGQERMDVVNTQMQDSTFKAMITKDNLQGTNTGSALDSTFRTKIKAVGTELAGVQTAIKSAEGNLTNAATNIMSSVSGAMLKVVNVATDSTNFKTVTGMPTTSNFDAYVSSQLNTFAGNAQKMIYGTGTVDASKKGDLIVAAAEGMGKKMNEAINTTGYFGSGVTFDTTKMQSTFTAFADKIVTNDVFKTAATTNGAALAGVIVNQVTQAGVSASNINSSLLTQLGTTTGQTINTTTVGNFAAIPGFKLANNEVTLNGTKATVSVSTPAMAGGVGNATYTGSFTPNTSVWGGVSSLSFAAISSGQEPLGPATSGTSTKQFSLGFKVVPESTTDKRRVFMNIDKVDLTLSGTATKTLAASIPAGAKLNYTIVNASGTPFNGVMTNVAANAITVNGDPTTGATITLSGSALITPIVSTLTSKDSSLTSFSMAAGSKYKVTTVMGGASTHLLDKDGKGFSAEPVTANGFNVFGDAIVGTVTAN
ncbi:MAG: hypothetical protein HQL93_12900 [Magnetococcales bacterium]|nr:hypothetical protein [Magnetococcales bacterium]